MKPLVFYSALFALIGLVLSPLMVVHASSPLTPPHRNHIATLEMHAHQGYWILVAFSPDGATLATGGRAIIRLWDVATKTSIATFEATEGVSSLAFSPDGATLASGSGYGVVELWDVAAKTNIATLEAHRSHRNISLAFSPDGATLASGADDGAVKLWDVATKTNIATLEGPRLKAGFGLPMFSATVAFSPDGATLAAGSLDGTLGTGYNVTVKLWDVATKTNIATFETTRGVTSVAFSPPDGAILAAGSVDSTVKLWDVATKTNIATFETAGVVRSVVFSPLDGAILATGSEAENVAQLWDVTTKTNIATFEGFRFVSSVALSPPDGAILAFAPGDGTVELWDVSEWTESGPPHRLVKTSGDGQEGPASTQLAAPFVVSVLDDDGEAIAGVEVTFSVTAGGGMLSAATAANSCTIESSTSSTTATTDANGQATTRLTLGSEPGANTVAATAAELDTVVIFTATATGQAIPHNLTKVCGDDQEDMPSEQLAAPFVVLVLDEDDAAIAGVDVLFAVTAGVGTLSAGTATTDANGRAATRLTLGSEPGTNTVSATVEGLEPETFTATGQESPLASMFDAFLGGGKLVALPNSPQVAQNAPNPFNSQTVLSYFLPAPGPAHLEVFALSGQRVAILHEGPQEAGYHRLHWDGRDDTGRPVASGMYLYRLVTDEVVLTRKLILLR